MAAALAEEPSGYPAHVRNACFFYSTESLRALRDSGKLPALLVYLYDDAHPWLLNFAPAPFPGAPRLLEAGQIELAKGDVCLKTIAEVQLPGAGVFVCREWVAAEEGLPYWALSKKRMWACQTLPLPCPRQLGWGEIFGSFKKPTDEDMVLVPIASLAAMERPGGAPNLYSYWDKLKAVELNFAFDGRGHYEILLGNRLEVLHGSYEDYMRTWADHPAPAKACIYVPKLLVSQPEAGERSASYRAALN